jgi:hypothetical protein
MYTREYFVERFREVDTDELLDRFAATELTEEAKDAIHTILRERGISDKQIAPLVKDAKKARYRRTSATNECDFCGRSARFSRVKDEGQKFCSKTCLLNARLMEASVDIPEQAIAKRAMEIRDGACPSCQRLESHVEVRKSYWVWSALVLTRWGTSAKVCCTRCGIQSNLGSILYCLSLGWWGIPWGIFITPVQIIANVGAMFRRIDPTQPSEELIQATRLQLAEVLLRQQASGPGKALRPTPHTARRA